MKINISPSLILNLSHSSFAHLHPNFPCSLLFLLHSAAGEDSYRRRNEAIPSVSSSSSSTSSSSLSRRNYEGENRNVKVTVWWDFENCNIPVSVNVHRVSSRITWAIRSSGIKGPITITAFGDVAQLSRATQEALTSTGICLTHVPCSGKNSSDRSFMADIVYWVYQNPPPAHFFLISGDKDFANILHRLRMSNYNILLASTESVSGVLCSAATIMWPWNGLVRGENVTVRHFNHPPDGLYGSWYGHYKGILDDPFAETDYPTTSQPEESMESISESKPRPIPRAVVNAIRQILHSYPEGISLTELRSELKRSNITIDKDFFGYKKFSLFIASLNLLKFVPPLSGDRQPLVVGALRRGAEHPDARAKLDKEFYTNGIYKDNGSYRKRDLLMDKISASNVHQSICKESDLDANSSASIVSKADHPVVDFEACKSASVSQPAKADPSDALTQRDTIAAKEGILKKLWKTLLGHKVGSVPEKDDNILLSNSSKHNDDKSITKDNNTSSEMSNSVHEQKVGLFTRILKRSKSWIFGSSAENDRYKIDQIDAAHELFSKTHFWEELEAFLLDPKGCHLVLKSRTREQLLRRLQNEGPPSLKEIDEKGLSYLADLLISEKKWVEESASQKFPFRLILTSKNSAVSQASLSNGLSSLFLAKIKPNSQKLQDQEKEEENLVSTEASHNGTKPPSNFTELSLWFQKTFYNNGHTEPDEFQKLFESKFNTKLCSSSFGYSSIQSLLEACSTDRSTASGKKNEARSRDRILYDCQKLLEELLEKNPTGFNISIFQSEFVKKYCYILDYQTLGYTKLVTLLQIMPGVRIENSFVRPTVSLHSEVNEGKEILMENGRLDDSAWDELGPLSNEIGKDYSPVSLSDNEYTDSEEEIPLPSGRSGKNQQKLEDSSLLLKILDSWDSGKEDGRDKLRKDVFNSGLIDCSSNSNQKPSNNGAASLQKAKLRASAKNYSFVMQDEDDKDSFAERILGEVKKAGDLRLKG